MPDAIELRIIVPRPIHRSPTTANLQEPPRPPAPDVAIQQWPLVLPRRSFVQALTEIRKDGPGR